MAWLVGLTGVYWDSLAAQRALDPVSSPRGAATWHGGSAHAGDCHHVAGVASPRTRRKLRAV